MKELEKIWRQREACRQRRSWRRSTALPSHPAGRGVYTFSLRLCDNEVDRDLERFAAEALETLGELFVGKSGIFDHQWTAEGQTARIYRTEMVREGAR